MPNLDPNPFPDPSAWGSEQDLAAIEFRAIAANRVAAAGRSPQLLKVWLIRLSEDVQVLIERLRDRGDS